MLYNLISTAKYRETTGGILMIKEELGKTTEKYTKMIYITFFSYLQFIKSLSSPSDQAKIKALQRRAWGSASLEEEKWVP